MKLNPKIVFVIVAITAVLFLLLLFARTASNSKIETAVAERKSRNVLNELIASTQNSHPFFNESLRGKTVVINIWATWCGPCREEIPELNKMAQEFKSDDIVFVALNDQDSTKEVKKMKEQKIQFDYTLLFDEGDIVERIQSFLLPNESSAIPVNIVINSEGRIEILYVGADGGKLKEVREYLTLVANKPQPVK